MNSLISVELLSKSTKIVYYGSGMEVEKGLDEKYILFFLISKSFEVAAFQNMIIKYPEVEFRAINLPNLRFLTFSQMSLIFLYKRHYVTLMINYIKNKIYLIEI